MEVEIPKGKVIYGTVLILEFSHPFVLKRNEMIMYNVINKVVI